MLLTEVLPKRAIQERFEERLDVNEFGRSDLRTISRRFGDDMHNLGLNIWHQIVQRRLAAVDPRAIAKWIDRRDPKLPARVATILGREVLFDVYCCTMHLPPGNVGVTTSRLVAKVFVAHVFPNDVHLADIVLQDPKRPIPAAQRAYDHTSHRGLGLLGEVMSRLEVAALELGADRLTLTAAAGDLVPLFEQYEFEVEDSDFARNPVVTEVCIPMERILR